jgi:polygalacturonase
MMKFINKYLCVYSLTAFCFLSPDVSAKDYPINSFGAKGDGKTLNTEAIQSAVDAAHKDGGGTVVVPKGVFITGAIFMKPGVNLHLEEEGVLKGSTDMENYPKKSIRIEGHFEENYSSGLINAEKCDGLRITGKGVLNGNGRPVWDKFWKLRRAAEDYKNFRNLSILRAQLCIINNSDNVHIEGVTFKDSQFWNLHIYNCRNVTIKDARFLVPDDYEQAPSTDGIDVDSSQNVKITGCYFSITDDCIAMKGTWGQFALDDKESMPVTNVHISNCTFKRGHAAVTCGSDASTARNILVEDCEVLSKMSLLCLKLRKDTPQRYENITIQNINVQNNKISIFSVQPWGQYINMQGLPEPISYVKNIYVSGIKGTIEKLGTIEGNQKTEFGRIILEDVNVKAQTDKFDVSDQIKELTLQNVTVNGAAVQH